LKLYDIQEKHIIFQDNYLSLHSGIQFYKNNYVIYPATTTELVIYDYILGERIELKTKDEIVYFKIEGDLLALSSGKVTELYDLGDVTKIHEKYYTFNNLFDLNFI